ncbi:MAG: hypothetical protein HYY51_00170 [Candidatus Magasanikbacteria bacterium]|nr:hypothetical protein [Candidatus Magasanikbacteria bacterium]
MKVHFIGICGVAMSALASALSKKGYAVSGSDKGFFPPISTHLNKAGIIFYPGWHVEKMTKQGNPDLVIVGNVAGSENSELLYAKKQKLKCLSYPELIAELFVKSRSIVCAGTYGKTSSSALLAWIFRQAGYKPSYMFGGLALNDMEAAELNESNWSILEGDEYKTARWDDSAKFFHYAPTHLVLSAIEWDHADIYKDKKSYTDVFKKLLSSIPKTGLVLAASGKASIDEVLTQTKAKILRYGPDPRADYQYLNLSVSAHGMSFEIRQDAENHYVRSPLIYAYMAENITGCFALSRELGIEPAKILESIFSFKGLKRRMEKRYEGEVTLIDDIAHSPVKAQSVLKNLRHIYKGKIYAVFEPNTGNRMPSMAESYHRAFKNADTVVIPRLSILKKNKESSEEAFNAATLANLIAQTHPDVFALEDDDRLIDFLVERTRPGDAIIFLGSHGFRGMIEKTIEKIKRP